ncbi:MAG TPA: M1 family aminopeptidase, partial [Vicinamibacterales bacterium]|nr:M1 family aminopeptidase [Vicinamibacterales bacterium]
MKVRTSIVLLALTLCAAVPARAQQSDDGVRLLLERIERVVRAGDTAAYFALLADAADRTRARDFAGSELMPGVSRSVLQERDRIPLPGAPPGNGYRLMVDVMAEFGSRARVATWQLDVKRTGAAGTASEWTIADAERISSVENIYRVSLSAAKQYAARDLKISAEDIDLTLAEGSVFVAEIDGAATAVVLLGKGTVSFHPSPATEKGQVKIFCGSETLETGFEAAYIRVNPGDFASVVTASALTPVAIDARSLKRAQEVFREEAPKSFVIDLGDLSREPWTLLPGQGDFLAEMRTRRFDTLTYARSGTEAEDITLFDRKHHHNIALYSSKEKLAQRGPFYNEDDLVDYDILDYDIDVAATPERQWIDGRVQVHLKVRSFVLGTLTFRLADSLVVQSIVSYQYGRLFGIRVKNQNTLVVNLPTPLSRDNELNLTITYAGRLEPQAPDREALTLLEPGQQARGDDQPLMLTAEPNYLYSSRSFWYPQATVSDYATARIRISVPPGVDCVASGELEAGFPGILPGKDATLNRKIYLFTAARPLRYLAFILSRFSRAETTTIGFESGGTLNLSVEANPRQAQRGRELAGRTADIALFYQSIMHDSPYPSFTVAVVESDLPGGHSPAYFAMLNQPLPSSGLVWRNDPAAFSNYPDFFIAHELAHQWWGQAVGWRNYHEQWLSEGFAQYFATLYAQHQKGDDVFVSMLRQLRKWGIDASDQGPISLGYRLGHIRGESRIFRALVYNKGAAVLHMLRRLVGDDRFFSGIRRFYRDSRFHKVGTEDLRIAMEAETGMTLDRFFQRWIYGSTIPRVKLAYRIEGTDVVLRIEQIGEVFDLPVTVTVQYSDRKSVDVLIPVTAQ